MKQQQTTSNPAKIANQKSKEVNSFQQKFKSKEKIINKKKTENKTINQSLIKSIKEKLIRRTITQTGN